jgi:hypothetical protein
MKPRMVVDFNAMDKLGRVPLFDEDRVPESFIEHLAPCEMIILVEEGDFEVIAVMDFDKERRRWVASPVWSTVTYLDRHDPKADSLP